jgi:hypothetical protein
LISGAICAFLLLAAYAITPYTAGGPEGTPVLVGADARYVVPALIICAAVGAWAAGQATWGPAAFGILGVLAVIDGISWGARGELSPASLEFETWVFGALAGTALVVAGWVLWTARARLRGSWRTPAIGLAAVALVVAVGGGYVVQDRFNDDRYRGADPTLNQLLSEADGGSRVGLAGLWDDSGLAPPLPAFGTRFGNEVEYVGPLEREMLGRYEREDEFLLALADGGYEYLIVGRGRPGVPTPQEGHWARSEGYELIARSARLDLYRRS